MANLLHCTKCFRVCWAMDAFGPIPGGALKAQTISPCVCEDCTTENPQPDQVWWVHHLTTSQRFKVSAPTAVLALGRHLSATQVRVGQAVDPLAVGLYVKQLQVYPDGVHHSDGIMALDLLVQDLVQRLR